MSGGRLAMRVVMVLAVVAVIGKYAPHPGTTGPGTASPAGPIGAGRIVTAAAGIRAEAQAVFGADYGCAANIITRESGWNPRAQNPTSSAYGVGQALPPDKMASAGPDWRDNPLTQLRWMRSYVDARYGGACPAWAWWQAHHWY